MKKAVTEERTFCDFCEEPGSSMCLVCGKDLCRSNHMVELSIYVGNQRGTFIASLCPTDSEPLLPMLETYRGKGDTWGQVGQNPEFNKAALATIINFIETRKEEKSHAGT